MLETAQGTMIRMKHSIAQVRRPPLAVRMPSAVSRSPPNDNCIRGEQERNEGSEQEQNDGVLRTGGKRKWNLTYTTLKIMDWSTVEASQYIPMRSSSEGSEDIPSDVPSDKPGALSDKDNSHLDESAQVRSRANMMDTKDTPYPIRNASAAASATSGQLGTHSSTVPKAREMIATGLADELHWPRSGVRSA